jgi:hypothetical protein
MVLSIHFYGIRDAWFWKQILRDERDFHFIANIKQIYLKLKRTIQKRLERKKVKVMVFILFLNLFNDYFQVHRIYKLEWVNNEFRRKR